MITTLSYQREGRIYNCKLLQYLRGIHFIHTWEWQVRMTEDGSSRDSFQFWGIAFLQVYSPRYLRKETFSVFTYSLCLSISLKLSQCNLYSPLMLLQARRFILFLFFFNILFILSVLLICFLEFVRPLQEKQHSNATGVQWDGVVCWGHTVFRSTSSSLACLSVLFSFTVNRCKIA